MKPPILLVGAGRMGAAMLEGWLAQGLAPIVAVEPNPSPRLKKLGVRVLAQIPSGKVRACVVALKPQILRTEAARLRPIAESGAPMISIAAGTSIATLKKAWGAKAHMLRAMPNTPGAIGRGITAIFQGPNATAADCKLAEALLKPLGPTIWVAKEKLIDVTTAVSGSGPAYVFLLVEALADAAEAQGMPRAEAEQLARATITGAGALLDADPRPPAELRRDVTSPGGTTEAALKVLIGSKPPKGGLNGLMARAVAAANKRAGELAS
ncbi:MAG TPA: pyrroline-5-carboxylate reductase [Rhizomicrobium sp.]|nr:pyrroline-5-carboxylate reductase [Rhizomicrobium sp.]